MKFCFPGELTKEQAEMYGYEFYKCKKCQSDYLVVQRFVSDVICEECGTWQFETATE